MVSGRTTAPAGLVLGHEITGEVIEIGADVEMLKKGDLVSVPFNVACGRCRTCKEQHTGVCLSVNPARAGGAYGYVDMGGWIGGQAEYVMVPYADFNLLRFPDKDRAMAKIRDLTMPVRHPADRLPRRGIRRRGAGHYGLHRRRWSGRPGCRRVGTVAGRGRDHRRRRQPRAPGACAPGRLRDGGPVQRRHAGRADRGQVLGRRKLTAPSIASASRRAATAMTVRAKRRPRAQLADGDHARGGPHRHSRPLCDRRSGRGRQRRQTRQPVASVWAWAGPSRTVSTPARRRS
jgi:hypothetical protein